MIKLCTPVLDEEDKAAVQQVLETGFLVQGPNVLALEAVYREFFGNGYDCALVSNCTSALHLALLANGVTPDDAVLVSAYSWPATANVIEIVGATPIFVDVDRKTMNITPETLEAAVERAARDGIEADRIKALMVVHAFGLPAPMDEINDLARRHDLLVIEDAACALGSLYKGEPCGSHSDISCFSLHPRKAITTGEGGFCMSKNPEVMRRVRAFRNHGQDPEASFPDFMLPGLNYRMTDLQAALGLTQMKKLDKIIERRRTHAANYDRLLAGSPVITPFIPEYATPTYQSYITFLPESIQQSDVIARMREKGIETNIGTYHIPMIRFFREKYGFKDGDFPGADYVFSRALALPLAYNMTEKVQEYVAETLGAVLSELSSSASRTVSTM